MYCALIPVALSSIGHYSDRSNRRHHHMTLIRLGHSPDPDDAFMFYALTQGLLDTEGLEISHVLADIESCMCQTKSCDSANGAL